MDYVCHLSKSLYGLKQAPRVWYEWFAGFIRSLGFSSTKSDMSLFVYQRGHDTVFLLLYVDDIMLTASTTGLLQLLTSCLRSEFSMKYLTPLHFFLGISVTRLPTCFFLSQGKYAEELLERANMTTCKSVNTPVDTNAKVSSSSSKPISYASEHRSIADALQYLRMTLPDITYAVQQVCLHMHDPRDCHMALVKHILRYVCGTTDYGLQIHKSANVDIVAYSDANWAGCPDTRRSTSVYNVFLGDYLMSWSSKRQPTVLHSSTEAEYRTIANVVAKCCWL